MKLTITIVLLLGAWFSSIEAAPAPRVQILEGDKITASLGQLRGTFQVRADKSQFDASTNTMNLSSNVALTAKDGNGRLFTLRAARMSMQNADLELQIEDKLFDAQIGWFDQLQQYGHIAEVPESTL